MTSHFLECVKRGIHYEHFEIIGKRRGDLKTQNTCDIIKDDHLATYQTLILT